MKNAPGASATGTSDRSHLLMAGRSQQCAAAHYFDTVSVAVVLVTLLPLAVCNAPAGSLFT